MTGNSSRGLVKSSQDATSFFSTYDPTPSAPAAFRSFSPLDPSAPLEGPEAHMERPASESAKWLAGEGPAKFTLDSTRNGSYYSDPYYYNILVGGANAGGGGINGISYLPFGALAKGKNRTLFRHNEEKAIREAIDLAIAKGLHPRVVGHSWGGGTVAGIAKDYPDVPFWALDPVGWFNRPKSIPGNLTVFSPDKGSKDAQDNLESVLAPIFGGRWPVIDPSRTVTYDGGHVAGIDDAVNKMMVKSWRGPLGGARRRSTSRGSSAATAPAPAPAAPAHGVLAPVAGTALPMKKSGATLGRFMELQKMSNLEKQANPFGAAARAVSPAFKRLFRTNGVKSRFFRLPSFFKKSPAAPAPTDWSQYFFAQGRWPDNVASFYDNIKLPIKRNSRLAGIPERDYRQTVLMRRGAYNDVPVKINRNLGPYDGYTHFRRVDSKHVSPTIEVGQYPNDVTLVHEFDHARNGAVGLSEKERNLLAKTYKFTPDDLRKAHGPSIESWTPKQQTRAVADEMSATNSEHQFAAYSRLWDRLHRKPTYDEYAKFIDNASLSDLRSWRKGHFDNYHPFQNAYQRSADDLVRNKFSEEDLENYRKALRWLGGFVAAPTAYRMYGAQMWNNGTYPANGMQKQGSPLFRLAAPAARRVAGAFGSAARNMARGARTVGSAAGNAARRVAGAVAGPDGIIGMYVPRNIGPDKQVRHFFDDILIPMKNSSRLNHGWASSVDNWNTALKDRNLPQYRRGFYDSIPIRQRWSVEDAGHISAGPRIMVSSAYRDKPRTIVHELHHAVNGDYPGNMVSRMTRAEDELLGKVYGIGPDVVSKTYPGMGPHSLMTYARAEAASTNAEHQFRVMQDLWNRLGRAPTLKEYQDFVDKASFDQLRKWRTTAVNGYQERADMSLPTRTVYADAGGQPGRLASALRRLGLAGAPQPSAKSVPYPSNRSLKRYRTALKWVGSGAAMASPLYGTQSQDDGTQPVL